MVVIHAAVMAGGVLVIRSVFALFLEWQRASQTPMLVGGFIGCAMMGALLMRAITQYNREPMQVFSRTLRMANRRLYRQANENLASALVRELAAIGTMEEVWDAATRNATIADVCVSMASSGHNSWTVSYQVRFRDGREFEGNDVLIDEQGRWKLATSRFLAGARELR